MQRLRRFVVIAVIVSLAVSGALGIIALLIGEEFGLLQQRVLGSTAVVSAESLAVLAYLAVGGRRTAWAGVAGFLWSLVPFWFALWTIWGGDTGVTIEKLAGVGLTVALTFAQACLLLAMAGTRRRGLLAATLLAMAAVATMICWLILVEGEPFGWFWRILGVVAIVDAIGTGVLIALGLATRAGDRPAPTLSPAVAQRLAEAARRDGTTPDDLVAGWLDRHGAG